MLKPVRFVHSHAPYNAGEVAGFDEATANRLIAAGVAVPYMPEVPEARAAAMEAPPRDRAMKAPKRK